MDFEERVKELVLTYRAPDHITEELLAFLLESGNAFSIALAYSAHIKELKKKANSGSN